MKKRFNQLVEGFAEPVHRVFHPLHEGVQTQKPRDVRPQPRRPAIDFAAVRVRRRWARKSSVVRRFVKEKAIDGCILLLVSQYLEALQVAERRMMFLLGRGTGDGGDGGWHVAAVC